MEIGTKFLYLYCVNINIHKHTNMALSKIGILAVKGTRNIAIKIAADQGISKQAVYQWINDNHENLTRASVLAIIREETGLADHQILEGASAGVLK